MEGGIGYSLRYSATVSRVMMYAAMPVYRDEQLEGVVRLSYPGDSIRERMGVIYRRALLVSILVLLLAGWVSLTLARRFSRVIGSIKEALGEQTPRGIPIPEVIL